MKVTYDAEVDAAYISLTEIPAGAVEKTIAAVQPEECLSEINLDFDADGKLLGIEVLVASMVLPQNLLK